MPKTGILTGPVVVFQPLAKADVIILREPDPLIKLDDAPVRGADLQIDFRTTFGAEQSLGGVHHGATKAVALMLRRNREIIEPAAVPVVTDHHGRNDFTVEFANQKLVRPHCEFALDVLVRVVPGAEQFAIAPQGNDGVLIGQLKGSDLNTGFLRHD